MMKPPCNLTQLLHRRVASRIRGHRLQVGMTQQQLARIIGVAFQQVHKYEHGLSRVSADRLYQIATALDSPVGYFFFGRGRPRTGRGEDRRALQVRDQ
jgi:transcriptional regulator with XRE-family HTH domain